ncbi:MAG: hypothetical protein R3D57_08670 [Hyphomicrobiaceae bacterium]
MMRLGLPIAIVVCLIAAWQSGETLLKAEAGLRQLIAGSVIAGIQEPGHDDSSPRLADWAAPQIEGTTSSVAMSEQDWLKLADDVAPVRYLPVKTDPSPLPSQLDEQQPL